MYIVVHIYICIYVYSYVYIYVYIYMYLYMYMYMYVYMYPYVHTYMRDLVYTVLHSEYRNSGFIYFFAVRMLYFDQSHFNQSTKEAPCLEAKSLNSASKSGSSAPEVQIASITRVYGGDIKRQCFSYIFCQRGKLNAKNLPSIHLGMF